MGSIFEKAFVAAMVAFISIIVPKIYKSGENKKKEHVLAGKVYYGIFRMIGLYLLAFMSGEMVLMIFLGNSNIDGMFALFLTIIASIPVMCLYLYFYKKHYQKLIKELKKEN